MIRFVTHYNKYGWRIIVSKNKNLTQIYLRSKAGHHRTQKPFYLRLDDENLLKLIDLLKKAVEEELKKKFKKC